ncbi:MAG TPA: hypothetical protein DD791_13365, partial [Syntrophomonas sp.]|nr:hypothetical protein [Syntrophomonas sp.]
RLVAANPHQAHIIYHDQVLTYQDSNAMACKLANALMGLGCRKGECISIILPNVPEIIISYMACYKTGMIAVGFNPRSTEAEIKNNLNNHRSSTVIVDQQNADKVIALMHKKESPIKTIIVLGNNKNDDEEHLYDFYKLIKNEEDIEPDIAITPEDIAILLYTGGTTGVRKGCCHTHRALVEEQRAFCNWFTPILKGQEVRNLICAPMTHIMGINFGVNWGLINGGAVVIVDTPTTENIVAAINQYEPTMWATVPALMNGLINYPDIRGTKIGALEIVIYGGASTAGETIKQFKKISRAKLIEGYGMSECVGIATMSPITTEGKFGSIGIPISDTDVMVVDPIDGIKVLPPDQKGEIIIRGPQVIKEYWENPEETAHAIRNGWLYTGDIGYMDDDGFLYLVDRKKDMIIVGGFNVYPREIDELLFTHPKIIEACTIGIPDPRLGEVPKSFVVLKSGETLGAEEVRAFCREKMIAYKVPKIVEFVDIIPKTIVNKPDKEALKRMEEKLLK